MKLNKWITKDWWNYLLESKSFDVTWYKVLICRLKQHPCGEIYYNLGGNEPNHYCKNCGDYLG